MARTPGRGSGRAGLFMCHSTSGLMPKLEFVSAWLSHTPGCFHMEPVGMAADLVEADGPNPGFRQRGAQVVEGDGARHGGEQRQAALGAGTADRLGADLLERVLGSLAPS